jgi:hypothetical protein
MQGQHWDFIASRIAYVDLSLELVDGLYGSRSNDNHSTSDLFTLHTTQQGTHVISGLTTFKLLVEHLDAGQGGLEVGTKTDDLDIGTLADDTPLDTSGGDGTTAGDGEDVYGGGDQKTSPTASIVFLPSTGIKNGFSRSPDHTKACQKSRRKSLSNALTRRKFEPGVASLDELDNLLLTSLVITALEGGEGGTHDDGGVFTIEVVGRQEISHFHINEFQHFRVRDHVDFVDEDNELLDPDLAGKKQMFTGLGHLAVCSRDDNDTTIHLSSTSDHVLDVWEPISRNSRTIKTALQSACPGQSMWP